MGTIPYTIPRGASGAELPSGATPVGVNSQQTLETLTGQLAGVTDAMTQFLETGSYELAHEILLRCALRQTSSQYGFIATLLEGQIQTLVFEGLNWEGAIDHGVLTDELRAYRNLGYFKHLKFDELMDKVLSQGQSALINNAKWAAMPVVADGPAKLPQHFLGVPIRRSHEVMGVIGVADRPGGYSGPEQHHIELLARAAGVLCDSYRRHKKELAMEKERRAAEDKLRESEERFRATFEQASIGVAQVGIDGRWLQANKRLCEIVGWSREELLGKTFQEITHPDEIEGNLSDFKRLLKGEISNFAFEKRYLRKDGSVVWANVAVAPVRDRHGKTKYIVAVIQDMTAAKEAATLQRERLALREAVSGMEQVLGVVAHELRTPLAGLRAMAEFLLAAPDGATQDREKFIKNIHDEVVNMSDTVNDLLEAARLNCGHAKWNWSLFPVEEVCADAVQSISPLVNGLRVKLGHRVEPADAVMFGDSDALRRLILNLLSNANKNTQEGKIEVLAEMSECSGQKWVEIRVCDTGAGIPAEIIPKLGEAFALNGGVIGSNHVKGSGLGLAICKGIIAAHGGSFAVESEVGRGTTVIARLRADLAEAVVAKGKIDPAA